MLKKFLVLVILLFPLNTYAFSNQAPDKIYNYIEPYTKQMPNQAYVIGVGQSFEEFVRTTGSKNFGKYVSQVLNKCRKYETSGVFFDVWKNSLRNQTFARNAIGIAGIMSVSQVYHEMDKKIINNNYIVVVVGNNGKIHDMAITLDTKRNQIIYRNPYISGGNFVRAHMPDWRNIITNN